MTLPFPDRKEAGGALAEALQEYKENKDTLVLALVRGGVVVGGALAETLSLPLFPFVVRKLGHPTHREFALGAIAEGGATQLDEETMRAHGVNWENMEPIINEEMQELKRRKEVYGIAKRPPLKGKTIILTDDGRVVFIDLGMVAEIPKDLMRPWTTTFLALGQRNAAEVARLLYIYSPRVAKVDYDAYERSLEEHFERFHGKPLGEVEIADVVGGVMNILRRYRITIDSSFTVVNIALLVAEGLGKQLDPSLDVVQRAIPVLFEAAASASVGMRPRREIPARGSA